jgi:hypothetical protein
VLGKPVVARFRVNLGPTLQFAARLERDAGGNTRIELSEPASQAPHFGFLWSLQDRADKLLFYHERFVAVQQWPAETNEDAWSFGSFEAEWTEEHEEFAGRDARKVILRKRSKGSVLAQDAGECWISEGLAMMMCERILGQNGSIQEWEVTEVEEAPPAGDVLATPPGFRQVDPS